MSNVNYTEIFKSKIVDKEQLIPILIRAKFNSQKVVFTNGCYDIIHRGHIELLNRAAMLGNLLIVGLNSDNSVRKLKGPNRPVQDEMTRALVLAAMRVVDYVVIFDEETPYELIKIVQPQFLVKGGDWQIKDIVGSDIVQAYGGKVLSVELVEGFSTTNIINKMCRE